jgi:uncharacterized membrane protein YfcA
MKKMTVLTVFGLLMLGLVAGSFSGLIGIGGGVIIVPALILLFGFSQQVAQGTTLALLVPPIGLLAVMDYYKKGFVNLHAAIFICIGFVVGGLMGAKLAVTLPEQILRRIFAAVIVVIGVRMFFVKG